MSSRGGLSAPSTRIIMGGPAPNYGIDIGHGRPNMGLSGPGTPGMAWDPRGVKPNNNPMAKFLDYGEAPKSHGHVALKSFEQIQFQYMSPPFNDGSDQYLMPDMLCFTVNEADNEEGTTVVLSIPKINLLSQQQWDDLILRSTGTRFNNPHYDEESASFFRALQVWGEAGLTDYAYALNHSEEELSKKLLKQYDTIPANLPEGTPTLRKFYAMSNQSGFCYLTVLGFLQRVSFAGAIINLNRATSLEGEDHTEGHDHFTQVNVGVAKRVRVGNVFGPVDRIRVGSKLWIELRRKPCGDGKYGSLALFPNGSYVNPYPKPGDMRYIDESGSIRFGHVFKVGTVLEGAQNDCQLFSIEQANGTSYHISEQVSFQAFGGVPTMYVMMGI